MSVTEVCAFWGFMGALIYAAPKFGACYFNAKETGGPWARCLFECIVAVFTGCVAAAAFSPWLARYLNRVGPDDVRAVAAAVGVIANPVAPVVIQVLAGRLVRRLKGSST